MVIFLKFLCKILQYNMIFFIIQPLPMDLKYKGWHRLEKYLNLEGFLVKSLKIKSALKITGKSLKSLE